MSKTELIAVLNAMEFDFDTISIDTESDAEFGLCDVTGERGMIVRVEAVGHYGDAIEFEILNDGPVFDLVAHLGGCC